MKLKEHIKQMIDFLNTYGDLEFKEHYIKINADEQSISLNDINNDKNKMNELESFLKAVLVELYDDKIIDCNQYQAEDFYDLFDRATDRLYENN